MLKNLVYVSGIAFILLLTILSPIGQAAATKSSAYDSGHNHGCSDARNGDQYINTPGKGASFHTGEFMRGYNDGHSQCSGQGGADRNTNPPSSGRNGQGLESSIRNGCINKLNMSPERCDSLIQAGKMFLICRGLNAVGLFLC